MVKTPARNQIFQVQFPDRITFSMCLNPILITQAPESLIYAPNRTITDVSYDIWDDNKHPEISKKEI